MIQTGLESLLAQSLNLLSGQRVGLATHPAAVAGSQMTNAVDALLAAGVRISAMFGPEHGFAGTAADGSPVQDGGDPRTGLPVFSLYGPVLEPTPEMLGEVDALVFDMQDVGVRFYTYLSTLFYVLRGGAKAGVPVFVLDRPNPLGGEIVEGPLVKPGNESFVGIGRLPIRHGMTFGELARLFNAGMADGGEAIGAELIVIEMKGWRRGMRFEQTSRPWIPTSPAMPHLSTAALYPGTCLLEGTNLSEGRGTALPFEICGAPWIDGFALADQLNGLQLPGAIFRPHAFTPWASKFAGQDCGGVQVHVTDRLRLRPAALGLWLVATVSRMYPEQFEWKAAHFDRLAGSDHLRSALEAGAPVEEMLLEWERDCQAFAETRHSALLYD